jgi:hypothetical protein
MSSVYLEVGQRRVFACALDWPGWCRSGKSEAEALQTLTAYLPRYAPIVAAAGLSVDDQQLEVVERLPGSATTDFGVPGAIPESDYREFEADEAKRLTELLQAIWSAFDRITAASPAELRKGPRGGGRDRDAIIRHVLNAESAYMSARMGLRLGEPALGDIAAIAAQRAAVVEYVRAAAGQPQRADKRWPARYMVRRMAWHVLDHAWEVEDRRV